MGDNSQIGWTQFTDNWVVGCEEVSDGCKNCYAALLASTRLAHTPIYEGLAVDGTFTGEVRVLEDRVERTLKLKRPRLVFVNSMSDWMHKAVPSDTLAHYFAVMALAHWHVYQGLTKRHGRLAALLGSPDFRIRVAEWAAKMMARPGFPIRYQDLQARGWERRGYGNGEPVYLPPWPLPNVWVGVSVEDQDTANRRIPALLRQPFQTFVSMEPMLAPVDLAQWTDTRLTCGCGQAPPGVEGWTGGCSPACMVPEPSPIGWVIVGGESGPSPEKLNRMDPRWAEDVVAQCQAGGVPVFFKQYGTIAARELGLRGKGASPARWPVPWPQEMPEGMWNPDTASPTSMPALAT